jgi:hypothetical protein
MFLSYKEETCTRRCLAFYMMYGPSCEADGSKIGDSQSSDCEELRLVGCDAV